MALVAPVAVEEVQADPATLEVERLELQLKTHAAHIAAALCRFLVLVAEYDRRSAYERWECLSCAQWLTQHCQVAPGTAREYVRVARALAELPLTTEAFGRGELSYSKVRALTRVATPQSEAELLALARDMSAAQLATAMGVLERTLGVRSSEDLARSEARRGAERLVEGDGTVTWVLHMSEEEDATLSTAIDHARDKDFAEAAQEGGRVPAHRGRGLPRLEAILAAVELGLAQAQEGEGILPERYLVVLHVEEEGYGQAADGTVVLSNGVRLHPRTAERLGCGAAVQLFGCGDGGARLGRRVRTFTAHQRRLIATRHPSCAFPGCGVAAPRCQFHHIKHWSKGGATDVDNGVPLCRLCRILHNRHYADRRIMPTGARAAGVAAGREG